ncbi:methyltransferase domain-containing protein [candidate division KSB3 bacterium]|uniref:Methyltransferase domain-containing protein n=1 Tax=candidate division KSB3 bacterium TaxID=2044937 RepID=A0A9D5JYB3_9BACT|nr:methyltransferase domain-containing protein [candidate division KSB3 bacterium]MBD3326062.1 methyltransferase domain-containing protein [candidate division KSB3 bacterium]
MKQHWQLQLAEKSLKKQAKIRAIHDFLEPLDGKACLEVGCDKGVLSHHLRQWGGDWISVDADEENLRITRELVKDHVAYTDGKTLQFEDARFDCIIAIDFLEHIQTDQEFLHEMARVLKRDGTLYITVPHTEKGLILNHVRRWLGFRPEDYGHVREGYSFQELAAKLANAGFFVAQSTSFSRFFSEGIELGINFGYFFLLSRKKHRGGIKGGISPESGDDVARHAKSLRLYTLSYPVVKTIGLLDTLIPFTQGYILMVSAKKTA